MRWASLSPERYAPVAVAGCCPLVASPTRLGRRLGWSSAQSRPGPVGPAPRPQRDRNKEPPAGSLSRHISRRYPARNEAPPRAALPLSLSLGISRLSPAREEEPPADRPRELVVLGAGRVHADVRVRAAAERVAPPVRHDRLPEELPHLRGSAEIGGDRRRSAETGGDRRRSAESGGDRRRLVAAGAAPEAQTCARARPATSRRRAYQ